MIRVLLVEDQDPFLYQEILNAHNGFEFIVTRRGDKAVQLARSEQPDVILMDLRLPGLNGLEAIRWIRRFDRETPIVAMSAYVDRYTRRQALEAGADDFFAKPPHYGRLYRRLVDLVAARPLKQRQTQQAILAAKQRRLAALKLKAARYGLETPVHILTEIEALEQELAGGAESIEQE
ncbi:MAG: response regulator [Chloroflexi bacterium]|nr:MAG: response regulator [Chloroflexota bacterium]